MSTHEDPHPAKVNENLRPTTHGFEIRCPRCDGWHMLQELLVHGCPQTGWRPDLLEIES